MSRIDAYIIPPARNLPEPVKYLVLAGEAYALYRGGKFALDKLNPNSEANMSKKVIATNKTDAQEILKNNLHLPPEQQTLPSYTKGQYQTFAGTLFTAMDGSGTDEDAIDSVFNKMDNDLDVLYLIDAFGTRAGTSYFASSTPTDLTDWLNSDGMTTRVNDILKTKANVTKRF